jgi:hypothetical protein
MLERYLSMDPGLSRYGGFTGLWIRHWISIGCNVKN